MRRPSSRWRCGRAPGLINSAPARLQVKSAAAYTLSGDEAFPFEPPCPTLGSSPCVCHVPEGHRICAEFACAAPAELLWACLTDYDSLGAIMPNLEVCERLPSRHPDVTLLYQKAVSQTVFWRVEATAVIEVREKQEHGAHELTFRLVKGDFSALKGSWTVRPDPASPEQACLLRYEIEFVPQRTNVRIPNALSLHLLQQALPKNIAALLGVAERWAVQKRKGVFNLFSTPGLGRGTADSAAFLPASARDEDVPWALRDDAMDNLAPGWIPDRRPMYLGVASVPVPPPSVPDAATTSTLVRPDAAATDVPLQPRVRQAQPAERDPLSSHAGNAVSTPQDRAASPQSAAVSYPPFDVPDASTHAGVEIHLRKLDVKSKLHRRLMACVSIDAPITAVWNVITDYGALADVVPVLAVSEVLPPPHGRQYPDHMKRLRQVAVKQLSYIQLHTEVILDVLEKRTEDGLELQFKQHSSDFDKLQGKWCLTSRRDGGTELRYAVEMVIHTGPLRALGLIEPLLERSIVEDVPHSLTSIRARAEGASSLQSDSPAGPARLRLPRGQARVLESWEELSAELMAVFGKQRQMPSANKLRDIGRVDIIDAVLRHGGFAKVAAKLMWSKPVTESPVKRPRGYWSSARNLQLELDQLAVDYCLPLGTIPTKSTLKELGRYDIFKAMERMGGMMAVASLLGYSAASAIGSSKLAKEQKARIEEESVGLERMRKSLSTASPMNATDLPSVADLLAAGGEQSAAGAAAAADPVRHASQTQLNVSHMAGRAPARRKAALDWRDIDGDNHQPGAYAKTQAYPNATVAGRWWLSREEFDKFVSDQGGHSSDTAW